MYRTRRLKLGDEQALRKIRLRALCGEPSAYGSSYAHEYAFVETDWRDRLVRNDAATFACAHDDGVAIGIVTGVIDESSALVAWLVAMWVDPESRRKGVASLLIDDVITWSVDQNCEILRLHVTDGNTNAEHLYEKKGFRRTGATLVRDRDNMIENEMELLLTARNTIFRG